MTTAAEKDEHGIDADKLSYEIFSILESKFLFGYDEPKLLAAPPAPPRPPVKMQRGKVRILSIDGGGGGGMRGILAGKALAFLEEALREKSGDPSVGISDYFDVAAGTGVGGVFAAMLFATRDGARPLAAAEDTWRLLADNGRQLFRRSPPPGPLSCVLSGRGPVEAATSATERLLKKTLGPALTLKDTLKPLLIPCYDLQTGAPLVFSRADALESTGYDFRLWEVCRATWAEPGRVAPMELSSVDDSLSCLGIGGGHAMGNPTAAAITHVLHNKQEFPFVRGVEDLLVLSIGTPPHGGGPSDNSSRMKKWTTKEWARPMARIASDGAADLVDHAVALAFGNAQSSNYVRIQANCSTMGRCGPDADYDPSPSNVKILLDEATEMLKQKNVESVMFGGKRIGKHTNMEKLEMFAGELVLEHQTRSRRMAPTVAFKQGPPKPK